MNHILLACVLLAEQDPLENIAREFKGREDRIESGYLWTGLWILLGLVAAIWLLAKVFQLYEKRRPINSSWMLFLSLSKAHRLRWSERWLLWRVARAQQLKDPARLFLDRERLEAANLPPAFRFQAERLEAIRDRLFAGLETDDTHGSESVCPDREAASGLPQTSDPPVLAGVADGRVRP
jgi:hypothetical protein